jgi:hypothetical protein
MTYVVIGRIVRDQPKVLCPGIDQRFDEGIWNTSVMNPPIMTELPSVILLTAFFGRHDRLDDARRHFRSPPHWFPCFLSPLKIFAEEVDPSQNHDPDDIRQDPGLDQRNGGRDKEDPLRHVESAEIESLDPCGQSDHTKDRRNA